MGRDDVKKAYAEDQYIQGAEYLMRKMVETTNRANNQTRNLIAVLGEPATYTDKEGVIFHVDGLHTNSHSKKTLPDGTEQKTIGISDMFKDPKYLGNPFHEAYRDPAAQFRVYCLANGVTEQEMLAMSEANPPAAVINKIKGFREPFVKMIIDRDHEAVADMYANFVEFGVKKADQIVKAGNGPQGILDNVDNMLLFSNAQNYLNQTLDLGGKNEPAALMSRVNEKLAAKGLSTNIYQFENFITPLSNMFQRAFQRTSMHDVNFEEVKEQMANPITIAETFDKEIGDFVDSPVLKEYPGLLYSMNYVGKEGYGLYQNKLKKTGSMDRAIASKTFDSLDYARYDPERMKVSEKAIEKLASKEQLGKIGLAKNPEIPDLHDLQERMTNHTRTTLGIKRSNSRHYTNVLNALNAVAETTQDLETTGLAKELKADRETKLNDQYQALKQYADSYLTDRNPSSPTGEERYRMVLEVRELAMAGLKKLEEAKKAPEKANAVEKDAPLKRSNSMHVTKVDAKSLLNSLKEEEKPKKRSKVSRMLGNLEAKQEAKSNRKAKDDFHKK